MLPQFAIAGHGSEPGRGSRGTEAGGRGAEEQQPPPAGRPPMPGRRRRGAQGGPGARSCLLWLFVLLKVSAGKGRGRPPHAPHHPPGPPLCARRLRGGRGSAPIVRALCSRGGLGGQGQRRRCRPSLRAPTDEQPSQPCPRGRTPQPLGLPEAEPPHPRKPPPAEFPGAPRAVLQHRGAATEPARRGGRPPRAPRGGGGVPPPGEAP